MGELLEQLSELVHLIYGVKLLSRINFYLKNNNFVGVRIFRSVLWYVTNIICSPAVDFIKFYGLFIEYILSIIPILWSRIFIKNKLHEDCDKIY